MFNTRIFLLRTAFLSALSTFGSGCVPYTSHEEYLTHTYVSIREDCPSTDTIEERVKKHPLGDITDVTSVARVPFAAETYLLVSSVPLEVHRGPAGYGVSRPEGD